ncbi:MAG: hypothetical protein J2P48_08255 [Alphaproteobacteria bacterium]|nr:hypothetical protein [Alphaproteobacteria bacterium]
MATNLRSRFASPPEPVIFRGTGEYSYPVPATGRYTIIAAGPGGGGSNLVGGTPQRFWGGGTGAISMAVRTLRYGTRIPVVIGRPGAPMMVRYIWRFQVSGGTTIVHGVTENLPWAGGGYGGIHSHIPQNNWDGNDGWADSRMNGLPGQSSGETPGVTMTGQSFWGQVQLTSGYGGGFTMPGGEGSVLFAYLGP